MRSGNIILLVICVLAIAIGAAIYFEASAFQKNANITEGTVVRSELTYFYVQYTSDDGVVRTFRGAHGRHKTHYTGNKVKVFYQKDNPDKARITDGVKGGKTTIIVAILLLLMDIFLIFSNRKKSRLADNFKTTGRKVEAEITKIDTDMETTILEKHPYFIDCRWVDPMTGKQYTHTIKNIWTDPKPLLAGRNSIDVYIDREDPEKYFMDIAFLGDIAM
jgi:hypothetical protein